MLEKPEIKDEKIIDSLTVEYGLNVAGIIFLPLGADLNTAVYRVETRAGTAYFLKLRRGEFARASVAVPNYLSGLGLRQIIPALPTRNGQLWASLAPFKLILYPYVEGRDGFERNLSDEQWTEFGAALKMLHTAQIPALLTDGIPREEFSPRWRDTVKSFLARLEAQSVGEPVAVAMAAFLKTKKAETRELVERAEGLAHRLQARPLEFILCHADMHAWNLLVAEQGAFYMVDWDTLIFAPKERDLMFIGAGLGGNGHPPLEEETLFYRGYGQTRIDPVALAYYRYERIIEDIGVFCEQIFLSDEGGEDRQQAFEYLQSNYLPGGALELARRSELSG